MAHVLATGYPFAANTPGEDYELSLNVKSGSSDGGDEECGVGSVEVAQLAADVKLARLDDTTGLASSSTCAPPRKRGSRGKSKSHETKLVR